MENGVRSRRSVLAGAAAGTLVALTVTATNAEADEPQEYNVGTDSLAAKRAARNVAAEVTGVLDWGEGEKTITGRFSINAPFNSESDCVGSEIEPGFVVQGDETGDESGDCDGSEPAQDRGHGNECDGEADTNPAGGDDPMTGPGS